MPMRTRSTHRPDASPTNTQGRETRGQGSQVVRLQGAPSSPIYPEMVMHEQRWGVKSSRDQLYPVGDPGEEYRAGVCCFCNFSGSEKCIKTKLPKKKLNARNY